MYTNYAKLVVIILVMISATILLGLGRISETTFVALVGPFGGYAVGNGINVAQGRKDNPLFGTSTERTEG